MTTDVMIFAILAVAVLLSAITWSLFIQWRKQRRRALRRLREVKKG
jgi:peptidoglycan/LPS O-acetylase OafA/YrhL